MQKNDLLVLWSKALFIYHCIHIVEGINDDARRSAGPQGERTQKRLECIGEANKLHTEAEYKVEITCPDHCLQAALQALVNTHPYEEPAYEAYKITTLNDDR